MKSIRISIFVICIIFCVPYMVIGADLEGTSPEQLISHVRAQHFPQYPASEGYATVGEALEKFFSKGVWKYEMKNTPCDIISFTGFAQINGKNARFKWVFSIITLKDSGFRYGGVMHEAVLINDTRVSDKEYGDILAAVLLN